MWHEIETHSRAEWLRNVKRNEKRDEEKEEGGHWAGAVMKMANQAFEKERLY